ncbi:leukemia inhibitory factor receptor isoform X1 [Xyrichtys novacula]|uniref:Leukemia inhibitory factor receptor isoform X1 n=1 Tax=Xyrichtys novacula TaxID=13765 RepID=A0AAV1G7S9_XYRNO|nr:leukemia inhibitory factor receptor isoform X1 [Xyrichtys novacula]
MPLRKSLVNLFLLCFIFSENNNGCYFDTAESVRQLPRPSISDFQAVRDKQSLVVSWQLNHSGLVGDFYEIQIGRTENHIIIYSENCSVLSSDQYEYTWTWTSDLPLECADHSARIRFFYNQFIPSPWSKWKTNRSEQAKEKILIYPFQRVLREGTSAMFCCIPPKGENITSISINNSKHPLISVDTRVKAISVENVPVQTSFINSLTVTCSTDSGNVREIWNYVSSPPQKPRNISCVTPDMTTVTCTWNSDHTEEVDNHNKKTHTLHIQNSNQGPVVCQQLSCTFPAVPQLEKYNISVVVEDQLGKVTEIFSFNISERVFPVVEWDTVSPAVMDTSVSWLVQGNLTHLDVLCQVTAEPYISTEVRCSNVRGFCNGKLEHLLPNTRYTTRVRCSAGSNGWGEWTQPVTFTTYPLVILDVWRRIEQLPDPNSREVTLLWTLRIPGSAATVNIQNYTVLWSQGGKNQTEWKDSGQTQAQVSIGPEQCDFTLQAVVKRGSTIPAHITVQQRDDQANPPVIRRLNSSTNAGFNLSWDQLETASCGYTVEWCIMGTAVPCTLQWVKVPEGNNTVFLSAGHFKAGRRYTFNIYGCRENTHRLLEVQTGYLQELKSVPSPTLMEPVQSTSSSVTLEWSYREDDTAYPAFISGYLVTVQEVRSDRQSGYNAELFNMSVADPQKKFVTVEGLQQNQEYAFSVSAFTREGAGQAASITVRTKTNYSGHMVKVLTPILLLLGCTVLLWPQRKTLQSGLKGIFVYPAGMNIKISEFDSFLQETGERLNSQSPEECRSCDIEILNTRPLLTETTILGHPEHLNTTPLLAPGSSPSALPLSCVPHHAEYCPQLWDQAVLQQTTCITNETYFHTMERDPSETQGVTLSDIKISLNFSDCQQEPCNVMSGYISNENL